MTVRQSEIRGSSTPPVLIPALANRRHDLDALRAFAMLLGIALHASLSFFPVPWAVQDSQQSGIFAIFMSAIHGFRMQLFFLLSGYFTMMLYRSRGMKPLLKQRTLRILLPCVIGVLTVVPLMEFVSGLAMQRARPRIDDVQQPLVDAIRSADVSAVQHCLESGRDIHRADARFGIRPLHWASLVGNSEIVSLIIEKGADVNLANADGNTPLHAAAFLGHVSVIETLMKHGANPNALNRDGNPPLSSVDAPEDVTYGIAAYLELPVPEATEMTQNRARVRELLSPRTIANRQKETSQARAPGWMDQTLAGYGAFLGSGKWHVSFGNWKYHLIYGRMFDHLWFLWFLCWLMAGFAVTVWLKSVLTRGRVVSKAKASSWSFFWLIPATMIPQFFMGARFPQFGPDTSAGVIPQPHILVYYGLFFAFGACCFEASDTEGRIGKRWWALLPLGLLVVFPIGHLTLGQRLLAVVIQPVYAWMMAFGMMGLFRATLNRPNAVFRYLSDASYWMYLAHLPLVIGLQAIMRDWAVAAVLKFLLINAISVVILLVTYQLLVRYTWIGLVLNGRRQRTHRARSGQIPQKEST